MLSYRAALPLSRATFAYLSEVIRRYRKQIGSYWRKFNPGRQALLVLAHPAQGRHVRRSGGWVRGGHGYSLAVCA